MVGKYTESNRRRVKGDAIRVGAVDALFKVLAPVAEFALDAGLSVRELKSIFQIVSVNILADHQIEEGRRHSISAIAATTGVSRTEISRIIKMTALEQRQIVNRERQPTNRLLAGWCCDSDYANVDGQPADLKIFGHGVSFNSLVRQYGRGLPTRAILDELVRVGSVEVIAANTVRLKTQLAVNGAFNLDSVNEFGERSAEFLVLMLSNTRNSQGHRFVSNVKGSVESKRVLQALRREIPARSVELTSAVKDRFFYSDSRGKRKSSRAKPHSVSLTVIYSDEPELKALSAKLAPRRRNMRRPP